MYIYKCIHLDYLIYSMVTTVNNDVMYAYNLLKIGLKCPQLTLDTQDRLPSAPVR